MGKRKYEGSCKICKYRNKVYKGRWGERLCVVCTKTSAMGKELPANEHIPSWCPLDGKADDKVAKELNDTFPAIVFGDGTIPKAIGVSLGHKDYPVAFLICTATEEQNMGTDASDKVDGIAFGLMFKSVERWKGFVNNVKFQDQRVDEWVKKHGEDR